MTLPKAIASGPSADTPEAVRPLRVALGAGVLAALYLLVLYLAHPVPLRLVALFGGASSEVQRHGGLEMIWLPPSGMSDDEIAARFRAGELRAHLERDHDAFRIRVPGVRAENAEETAKRLGGEHGLEFHVVVETEQMKQLASLLRLPMNGQHPVDLEVDQWRPDEGGTTHTDYYLLGDTVAAIEAKLAEAKQQGWALPAGTRIAYEHIETDRMSAWRTYVIEEQPALGGEAIANAMKTYDPNTNRPLVLLDFTREGGQTFGELTSRIVGQKLATMFGDQVYSAPIINGAIRGGRASITMGGSDHAKQEREAEMLVSTLQFGALPKGGQIVSSRYVAPTDDKPMQWLARGTIALGGGALIALLVWMVVHITRPVRRAPPRRSDGPPPVRRLLVTLVAPLAAYALSQIVVLGVSRDELVYALGGAGFASLFERASTEQVSFGALGIMPVINAFIFVEVLALIVPGWRRRRHAGPDARAPITAAVVITAATLLVIQAWFVTQYLYSLGAGTGAEVLAYGMLPRLLVIASFAIGTLVLVGVAAIVREHGLGNGYGALVAGGWLYAAARHWLAGRLLDPDIVIGGITLLAIAIPLAVVARWRIARVGEAPLRLPTSGVAPLGEAGGLVLLLVVISRFPLEDMTVKLYEWMLAAREHRWILIALLAAFTLLWSFAFARPAVTRTLAERVGLVAPAQGSWAAATGLSCALLLLAGATAMVTTTVRPSAAWLADAVTIAIVTMVVLDVVDDWRGRRLALERVWSIQQPQHADLIARALDDAGIPHHLASANLRTLLAFFGPFAPIDVYVPVEHAPAARARLRELVA